MAIRSHSVLTVSSIFVTAFLITPRAQKLFQVLAFSTIGLAASPSVNANYVLTDLGTLSGIESTALAVNNSGQVAGADYTPDGNFHAVIWAGSNATDLGTFGGAISAAYGINAVGQVVGLSALPDNMYHATVWNGTTATDLGSLGGTFSAAYGMNDYGQAVGYGYLPGSGGFHAAIWQGLIPTDLGTLGGTYSMAKAINNAGQVVGWSYTTNDVAQHATIWNGTIATDLGTLGGNGSVAYDINISGQVVGWSYTPSGGSLYRATIWNGTIATELGALWEGESIAYAINDVGDAVGYTRIGGLNPSIATIWRGLTPVDLNTLLDPADAGWHLAVAWGINDSGQIVGQGTNGLGELHGFLLTPADPPAECDTCSASVPETGTLALVSLGLIGMSLCRRRKS